MYASSPDRNQPIRHFQESSANWPIAGSASTAPNPKHVGLPAGLNIEEEKAAIRKELDYLHGFLKSVDGKLSNERFVANAKGDVVEKERQKKADAEEKIRNLQSNLKQLEGQ